MLWCLLSHSSARFRLQIELLYTVLERDLFSQPAQHRHHIFSDFFFFFSFLMALNWLLFSVFQIQTDYSKQTRGCPVLSAPLELNKHFIINGHQALDQRAVFVAWGMYTHRLLRMEREVGSYTSGFCPVLCGWCQHPNIIFNNLLRICAPKNATFFVLNLYKFCHSIII